MKKRLYEEWSNILLMEKSSPYVFRTRLERTLNHTTKYADITKNLSLSEMCSQITRKLQYLSDQSNQTTDGCLNSYIVLKQDMIDVQYQLGIQSA